MNKKIGKSIYIGVIIFFMVFSLAGIVYTSFSNVYGKDSDEMFMVHYSTPDKKARNITTNLIVYGKWNHEEYYYGSYYLVLPLGSAFSESGSFVLNDRLTVLLDKEPMSRSGNEFEINGMMVSVENGFSRDDSKVLKRNYPKKDIVRVTFNSHRLGKHNITFKIGDYETTINVNTLDAPFRFALADNGYEQKSYTGKYALKVGNEYSFQMKLPTGKTMKNVSFWGDDFLGVDNNKKILKPTKTGKGKLNASVYIGSDETYASVEIEVVDSDTKTSTSSNDKNTSNTGSKTEYVSSKNIKFDEEKRIITFRDNGTTIYSTPKTTGIPKGKVEFSVSDSSIAEISNVSNSNKATLKIKKTGTFTLTASYDKYKATQEITVYPNSLSIFEKGKNNKLNDEYINLKVGDTFDLSAKSGDNQVDNSDLLFTSSNEKICTVDSTGKITALKKGSSTVKVLINKNTKTYGRVYVKVSESAEDKMQSEEFSFPKDKDGKVIQAKGENALVVGQTYTYNLIRPKGTEDYKVTYECSNKNLLEIKDNKITPLKAGKGNLIAKMKIGNKVKTASMSFEIFATEAEKNNEKASNNKYLNIDFTNSSMVIEKGNVVTLKPRIDTNMKKSEYTLVWSSSNESIATVDKNGRLTTRGIGNTTVTVESKQDSKINATIDIEVKEKVVLVKALKFVTQLDKNGSAYLIRANEPVEMNFEISPENATLKDYSIEVDDKENFLVQGKTVVALKDGVKTKLTARSLDSGNRTVTITLESIISGDELSNLQRILDVNKITVKVGETLKFSTPEKSLVSKSGSNFSYKTTSDNVVTVTGNKIGEGELKVKANGTTTSIPVNVVAEKAQKDDVSVKSIELAIDPKTSQPKNYTTDYPLVVDKCYNVKDSVSVYPANASNKDINVEVSDKDAFTVTSEGNIIANKADASAVVTLSSVSNPEVVTTFKVASTSAAIKKIRFAKDYVGDKKLTTEFPWNFNLYITLDNGETFDPTAMSDPDNNQEYQKYLKQIVIESSDASLLEFDNTMTARVVRGKNGTGTLTAYVKSNSSIKATAKFETEGITDYNKIKSAKFAKELYEVDINDSDTEFCPIITLENNFVYDPSKDYGKANSVANSDDYRNYIEQLKLEIVSTGASSKILEVNNISNGRKLSVNPKAAGTCEIVLKLKSTGEELSRTRLQIVNKESTNNSSSNVTADIKEIDHATTTSNRNLKITDIKFAQRSYNINDSYIIHFQPEIKLSDGTRMNHESADRDTYLFYVDQTELYFTNENESSIDFGVAELVNSELPRAIVPLKKGKVNLAVGLKSTKITYDIVPVTIDITNSGTNSNFYTYTGENQKISSVDVPIGTFQLTSTGGLTRTCKIKLPDGAKISDVDVYINGKKLRKSKGVDLGENSLYKEECYAYSGEDYDMDIMASQSGDHNLFVVGKRLGANDTIVFKAKNQETSLKVNVTESPFRFPLDGDRIKEYTGNYALELGGEYDFNPKLPSDCTLENINLFAINDDKGCVELSKNNKAFIAKKTGYVRIGCELIKSDGTRFYTYTNAEVVTKKK